MTPELDKLPPILHSDEYHEPVPLGSTVNTAGAEDSPFITLDGKTLYFVFAGLGASPTEPVSGHDVPLFRIFWEDLQHVCRLALEIESIPDHFQEFNVFSCEEHGKYRLDKLRSILGFEPTRRWADYFKRRP